MFGDNAIASWLARTLATDATPVVLVDPNETATSDSDPARVRVVAAHPLDPQTAVQVDVDARAGAIGACRSPAANYLLAERIRRHARTTRCRVLLKHGDPGVTGDALDRIGAEILSGSCVDIEGWLHAAQADALIVALMRRRSRRTQLPTGREVDGPSIALVHRRGRTVEHRAAGRRRAAVGRR